MRTTQLMTAVFAACTIPLASAASNPTNNMFAIEAVPPPGPVQPGALTKKCSGWVEATKGMTCDGTAKILGISIDAFKRLNPQIKNGDCEHNFWASYYYCTGTPR
ncbi:hypothetical protein F4777DRAFT_539321 [Nemania sp. FL0916]|nr:hypothetical protein F4777DRAFT_539321 [Nemania sp. FL0916]